MREIERERERERRDRESDAAVGREGGREEGRQEERGDRVRHTERREEWSLRQSFASHWYASRTVTCANLHVIFGVTSFLKKYSSTDMLPDCH